jgi:hypothetical protein
LTIELASSAAKGGNLYPDGFEIAMQKAMLAIFNTAKILKIKITEDDKQ